MPFHEVRDGETLMELALAYGLDGWRTILEAPENAELAKTRTDPGILKAGDRVFVPNRVLGRESGAVDQSHQFKMPGPQSWLRLAVRSADASIPAGAGYALVVEGKTVRGEVPPDGVIEHPAAPGARTGSLVVESPADDPDAWPCWDLEIGSMDPLAELSGVQARLENLGFPCGGATGEPSPETEAAIRAFQERIGAEPTGEADDILRAALSGYYDPGADESAQEVAVEPSGPAASEEPAREDAA